MFSQVLELEQQHSTALLQLSQTYNTEKEELIKQHQLQLQVHVWHLSIFNIHCLAWWVVFNGVSVSLLFSQPIRVWGSTQSHCPSFKIMFLYLERRDVLFFFNPGVFLVWLNRCSKSCMLTHNILNCVALIKLDLQAVSNFTQYVGMVKDLQVNRFW